MENLIKIQNELKVPKGNFNSFGKYKYRSCEDILEALKPLLKKYGCTLKLSDEINLIGTKIFLKSTATIKDNSLSESSDGFAETSEHKGMSAEQTTGTASSYARKYALNGLFLIDETEQDADNDLTKGNKVEPIKIDIEGAKAKIITATSLDDLKNKFTALTRDEQNNSEVIALKDKLKNEFSK